MDAIDRLRGLIARNAMSTGEVSLASGASSNIYFDLRRVSLHHEGGPLVGRVMLDLTKDLDFDAVGGLTLGADPIATAMMHAAAPNRKLDAFVVRKEQKGHGLSRRIEGPDIAGRRVLVVEDVCTTGTSANTAAWVAEKEGATIAAIAAVIDRGGRQNVENLGYDFSAVFTLLDWAA